MSTEVITKGIPLFADAKGKPGQLGIVVPDLKEALKQWGGASESWRILKFDSTVLDAMTYEGQPSNYSMLIALSGNDPQIELIQPLEGPSIYEPWIENKAGALHHLGFFVSDVKEAEKKMTDAGFGIVQQGIGTGPDGSGGFTYFDTLDVLGYYLEAIELPGKPVKALGFWPDGDF